MTVLGIFGFDYQVFVFFVFLKSNCRYNKVIYECVNLAVMQNATLLMNKVIK